MEVSHLESNLNEVVISSYDGDYDDDMGEYTGFAVAKLDNECIYEGKFLNGLFHGNGKFTWSDGVVYEGDFYRNQIEGQGTYSYTDGSVYVGALHDGKRHGQGKLTNSGGQIYDGAWKDGRRHGVGKMFYNEEQTITYTGEWFENNRHGYGVMRYASGNTYEGHWQDDRKSGFGVMIWRDMDETYIGEWLDDQPHGFGEHIWGDSNAKTVKKQCCNIYRGEFEKGQRHGRGTFFYMNGATYTGYWQEDAKHGPGVFVHPDGKILVGDYDMNRLVTITPNANTTTSATTATSAAATATKPAKPPTATTNAKTTTTAATTAAAAAATPSSATSKKGSTNAPAIATKLPSIPEASSTASATASASASVAKASSITANTAPAPPSTANANASSAHPNNISVQYHLHIADLLAKFPSHPRLLDFDHHTPANGNGNANGNSFGKTGTINATMSMSMSVTGALASSVDYAKTLHERSAQMHEIERLLLKYNTHLKTVYRRFNEQANRLRQREAAAAAAAVVPPLPTHVSPYSPPEKTWKLRKAALQARAFQKRVHCASLRDATQFLRELGLLNGREITAYDVAQIFRAMKRQHERSAIDLYREYLLQQLQWLEDDAQQQQQQQQQDANNNNNNNATTALATASAALNECSSGSGRVTNKATNMNTNSLLSSSSTTTTATTDGFVAVVDDIESEEEYTQRRGREQRAQATAIKAKLRDAQIAIGQLMDDFLLFDDDPIDFNCNNTGNNNSKNSNKKPEIPYFDLFPSSSSSPSQFHRLALGQQPLLEHEFMELFVRVALEFALRHGYNPNANASPSASASPSFCWAWMTPYQVLEHVLAEKVFPLANHGPHDVAELVHDLYDEHVQDLFHQRPNKLLDAAFSPDSLASFNNNNNAAATTAALEESDNNSNSSNSAQRLMLAQWEALKAHAIERNQQSSPSVEEELHTVAAEGVLGCVRLRDFVDWFVRNNTPVSTESEQVEASEQAAMQQQKFASLRARVTARDVSRVLSSVDASASLATAVNDLGEDQGEGEGEDSSVGERKMVYEDFAEALARIWSQSDAQFVQVVNPLFHNNNSNNPATASDEGSAAGLLQLQAAEQDTGVGGVGGWLDVGSSVSSSVLGNQLLHRLLLWLLTQRQQQQLQLQQTAVVTK